MVFKNFDEIKAKCQSNCDKKNIAVVCAEDEHTLEAVMMACEIGIIRAVLIGDEEKIKELVKKHGKDGYEYSIIPVSSKEEAVKTAVEMAHKGEIDAIMKGLIQTADLMRPIVSKNGGLRTEHIMSHIAFKQMPNYHKIVCLTDVALVTYPDLEQKKQLILNAVDAMRSMGYSEPKVAVLAPVEAVNPKMPVTVDAAELKRLNQVGEITQCIIEGPISYDLALVEESVKIKGYSSPVAADADILLLPDINAGNILIKCLESTANAPGGGFIVGGKVPIVLTSRSTCTQDKFYSLVLISCMERGR